MRDLAVVQSLETETDLAEHLLRLLLGVLALLLDPVEELATRAELHHQVQVRLRLEHIQQLDDVGVVERTHDRDFIAHALELVRQVGRAESRLVDGLHGHLHVRRTVRRDTRRAILARAEHLAQNVPISNRLRQSHNVLRYRCCCCRHRKYWAKTEEKKREAATKSGAVQTAAALLAPAGKRMQLFRRQQGAARSGREVMASSSRPRGRRKQDSRSSGSMPHPGSRVKPQLLACQGLPSSCTRAPERCHSRARETAREGERNSRHTPPRVHPSSTFCKPKKIFPIGSLTAAPVASVTRADTLLLAELTGV